MKFCLLMGMLPLLFAFSPPGSHVLRGVNDYQAGAANFVFPAVDSAKLNLTCRFTVPEKPPSWDGETQVYLWCGVNWYDSSQQCLGVLQPVLTFGCSPNAMSNVGCGTNTSDPHYADDPYWYFSSQYVVGWGPGQAFGSPQVIKTVPGRVMYSEMWYDDVSDSWIVYGRDESTRESSTLKVMHPMNDVSRSWRAVHADPKTQATAYAVSEPHQVNAPSSQMPQEHDFQFIGSGPASALQWQGGVGTAKVEQQGGPACEDQPSAASDCVSFTKDQCEDDLTWCKFCSATCGKLGASCGCVPKFPAVWKPTIVGMDLTWHESLMYTV